MFTQCDGVHFQSFYGRPIDLKKKKKDQIKFAKEWTIVQNLP